MTDRLETERFLLRPLRREDAGALMDLDADPDVRRYVDMPSAPTAEEVERALDRMLACAAPGLGFFAAIEKEGGAFLGWFHFRRDAADPDTVDLGYKLRRASWGRGVATEGARALIHRGFTLQGIQRVTATALAANTASRRVMEKCGMACVETFAYDGIPAVRYTLNRDAWRAARNELPRVHDGGHGPSDRGE